MKKLIIFLFIAVLLAGTLSAQDRNNRLSENNSVTIDGTLKLERGIVAVESGDSVYYVPMLNRYIGFINDLREGARVSVEGRAFRNTIQPTKVTIGGKSYDFPATNRGPGFENRSAERRRENFGPDRNNFGNRGPDRRRDDFQPGRNNFGPSRRNGCCR